MTSDLTDTFDYECLRCETTGSIDEDLHCPQCGEPRALLSKAMPPRELFETTPKSLWHYLPMLPIAGASNVITLDEGATPLVQAPRLARDAGMGEVLLKLEGANPTGSFKDRQVAVGMSHAREMGVETVAAVSSGNVAAATAAYAARAGMKAVLFMHGQASATKIAQAAAYGATVLRVDSPKPTDAFDLCLKACAKWGWHHMSTAGMYEPYNVEGAKTLAYEIYRQTGGDVPDWIVAPVGGGGLFGCLWRGFRDLQRLGLIERLPRLAGIQAAGCAPLLEVVEKRWTFTEHLANPWPNPHSIAGGIADDILFDGHTAIPAIRESGGVALAVSDEEIVQSVRSLASLEGVLCEFCSAVTIAALERLPGANGQTRVCCILTGSGVKDLAGLAASAPGTPLIRPNLDALEKALSGS